MKLIFGLGLIPLGVFVGSLISIGEGSAAVLGGILGIVLCCILFWSGSRRRISYSREEQHQINSNVDKQAIENTMRSIREAHLETHVSYLRESFHL